MVKVTQTFTVHACQGRRKQSADGQTKLDVGGEAAIIRARSAWQNFGPSYF